MASWWGRFARPVACRPHCRRRGRLNPFKGVVMGGRKGRALGRGTDFYDSKKDEHGTRRVPCFFSRSRVLSISFFLFSSSPSCTPFPLFSRLSSERSMVDENIHRNLYGSSRITLTYTGYVYAFFQGLNGRLVVEDIFNDFDL